MKTVKQTFILIITLAFFSGFTLTAQDGSESTFRRWALTPPMGWNSWDCYGPSVVESEVMQNARYMATNLKEYGWEYVVVDIRWFVDNQKTGSYLQDGTQKYIYDQYGRYLPSPTRFPSSATDGSFKPLADSIHALGLKFGIHIMRGVPKVAVSNKCPIKGSAYRCDQIYNTDSLCGWLRDNYTVDCTKPGAQQYYNSIFDLYAGWGVDFIKIDDLSRPYHDGEIALIRNAIDQCGRPIILSMSPGATPLDKAASCRQNANMWRMMDDYWDLWGDLENEFTLCRNWAPYYRPGNYPDCDMLPLGMFLRGERATNRWTRFTNDEQRTMMTLFGIFHSPFFFGGDLTYNDTWTNSLLTNREMLKMHAYGVDAHEVSNKANCIVWSSQNPANGDRYAALFNTTNGEEGFTTEKALYRSETISMLTTGYSQEIQVEIPDGSTLLALVTDDNGDNNSYDHGDWVNPTLIYEDGSEGPLLIKDTVRVQTKNSFYKYIRVNRNILNNGKLNINDSIYERGFSTHANCMILFHLPTDKKVVGFKALAGIDRTSTSQSGASPTLKFMVFNCDPTTRSICDVNRAKASSGYISRTYQSAGVQLTADITGAKKLYLVVTNGDDNFNYDHANWVNPTLIEADGSKTSLTAYNYTSAVTDWQNIALKNKNVDGGTLNINGTNYTKGIGTNSNAVIIYDLPANKEFVTFTSFVGYDYAMRNAPNGVTMEFLVFTEDPTPDFTRTIPLDLTAIGIEPGRDCHIYDIWEGKDAGIYKNSEFTDTLRRHASSLYRITPLNRAETNSLTLEQSALSPDSILLTATLDGSFGEDSYVQFLCNGKPVGCVQMTKEGSVCYLVTGYKEGSYNFTACYGGSESTANVVSNSVDVVIEPVSIGEKKMSHPSFIQINGKTVTYSDEVAAAVWYNLNGQCDDNHQRGFYLVRMVLHNGKVYAQKVLI